MPAITGNGTCLYDFQKEISVENHFLTYEDCLELVKFCRQLSSNIGFRGTLGDGFVITDLENYYERKEYEALPNFMNKRIFSVDEWNDFDIYKVNVMDDEQTLKEIYPLIAQKFSKRMTVSRAGYTAIEVMPYGTSKAVMLKKTVNDMFGDGVMLCTVGDHDNDLEMHKISDLAVCPANANDNVKKICKLCLCDNDHGVVADLIDHLDDLIK